MEHPDFIRTVLVVAVSATFGLLAFVWFLDAVS